MHGAVWTTAERTEDHDRRFGGTNTKGKPPAKTPGVHSIEGCLQVGLRVGQDDQVVRIELAYVPEGVRVHNVDTGN